MASNLQKLLSWIVINLGEKENELACSVHVVFYRLLRRSLQDLAISKKLTAAQQ